MNVARPAIAAVLGLLWTGLAVPSARGDPILFEFGPGFDVKSVESRDARVVPAGASGTAALRIATGHANLWPGITLKAPHGPWDLSRFQYLAVDVKNAGSNRVEVSGRVDSPATGTARWSVQDRVALAPGETKTLRVWLQPRMPDKLAATSRPSPTGGIGSKNCPSPARRWRGSTAAGPGLRTAPTRARPTRRSPSRPPTVCASTATSSSGSSPRSRTAGCEAGP